MGQGAKITVVILAALLFLLIPVPLALYMGATKKVVNPTFLIAAIVVLIAYLRQRKEMGG